MLPILVGIFTASMFFGAGQVSASKPDIVVLKDGVVTQSIQARPPVLVVLTDSHVEVREARGGLRFTRATPGRKPFYVNAFGEVTASCAADCHEGLHTWERP